MKDEGKTREEGNGVTGRVRGVNKEQRGGFVNIIGSIRDC